MTELQVSVRTFITLPTHRKIPISIKMGYENFYKKDLPLHESDKLFFEWVKRENKTELFIKEIKDYTSDNE